MQHELWWPEQNDPRSEVDVAIDCLHEAMKSLEVFNMRDQIIIKTACKMLEGVNREH